MLWSHWKPFRTSWQSLGFECTDCKISSNSSTCSACLSLQPPFFLYSLPFICNSCNFLNILDFLLTQGVYTFVGFFFPSVFSVCNILCVISAALESVFGLLVIEQAISKLADRESTFNY